MVWTKEQQEVISLRNRNILVSAAAGSGKTAVLVERIISMITDEENPVDIDHLLIVTFTNAAAAEMRERIRNAIDKKLEEDPLNTHLQKQSSLVHNAQITTIHSFCLYVIRGHFQTIGLDPSFRVADEGELQLIKNDVLELLLEEKYEEKSPSFYHFIESFAPGRTDEAVVEYLLKIYHFSMSYPWPTQWMETCKKAYHVESIEDLEQSLWMKSLLETVALSLGDIKKEMQDALEIATSLGGPYMYVEALQQDILMLEELCQSKTYQEYGEKMQGISYARLSSKKDPEVSDRKKETIKAMREEMKKTLKKLKEQFFYSTPKMLLEDMKGSQEVFDVFMDLAKEFYERFTARKREKNIVDFNDLEHLALQILVEKDGEEVKATEVAKEFQGYFEEILVDEYQDSNLVQETLLTSISKQSKERRNMFMVGDVKQSIYRFRLARPELFMEKYQSYSTKESDRQRINLHKNFRSRKEVLDSVNFFFDQMMASYLGDIDYDYETALYTGATFPEGNSLEFQKTEVLLLETDSQMVEKEEIEETKIELEARMVGKRILEMVGHERVLDKETNQYRFVEYRDIVILFRTVSRWAETFSTVLSTMGIPAFSTSSTGYFSTLEIQTILSYLQIIDNPRQDIPLTAVLHSPISHLSGEELAKIRGKDKKRSFYDACMAYGEEGEEEIQEKLHHFFKQLMEFRKKVPYTPMHELLWDILDKTGYGDYLAAMPGGDQRKANVEMLVEKAIAYESTSYRGLFNFIRYIENIRKYQVDFGEASINGENDNTVRIMSIHKSKGLEFPIVFVSALGKSFNQQDSRSKIALHPDLGVGIDYVNIQLRTKTPTLLKKVIQRRVQEENQGEELRVLYVAFTRAKEKLILTGSITKLEEKLEKWSRIQHQEEKKLSFHLLMTATTYLEWILPSLMRHREMGVFLENFEKKWESSRKFLEACSYCDVEYQIKCKSLQDVIGEEIEDQVIEQVETLDLKEWDPTIVYSKETAKILEQQLEEVYPFEEDRDIVSKVTVSELKRKAVYDPEQDGVSIYPEEITPIVPKFIKEQGEVSKTDRGTAYHRFLQLMDFKEQEYKKSIDGTLEDFIKEKKISREMADSIYLPSIKRFLKSSLVKRMIKAQEDGNLYKEQPFVLGVLASEIDAKWSKEEEVLIQGIIDVYFYEGEEIILVDYKTDYLKNGEEEKLILKYQSQLSYYAKALEQVTGKKVKEKVIYSFSLNKEINL